MIITETMSDSKIHILCNLTIKIMFNVIVIFVAFYV